MLLFVSLLQIIPKKGYVYFCSARSVLVVLSFRISDKSFLEAQKHTMDIQVFYKLRKWQQKESKLKERER